MFDCRAARIVKTTGDGILIEFASVVDLVRCAVVVQRGMLLRNHDIPGDKRIECRVGIHLGDVVVEGDDLLGDGVNVAARLDGMAEPGGVCISEDAYRHLRGKVDAALIDMGEQRLKNIAQPVRVYAIPPAGAPTTASVSGPSTHTLRLSIVVLPFANLGGDKEQDYFVDCVTESLTTELSPIPGAFVIARNTAFTYKDKAVDARQIGREFGVRYVLDRAQQLCAAKALITKALNLAPESASTSMDCHALSPRADTSLPGSSASCWRTRRRSSEAPGTGCGRGLPQSPDATNEQSSGSSGLTC